MWIKVPFLIFRENPVLIQNLEEHRFNEEEAAALKGRFESKKRLYSILLWLVTIYFLGGSILPYCLEEYYGISIPYSSVLAVTGFFSCFPDIFIFNKFLIYRSLLRSLKLGYPDLWRMQ